MIAMSQSRPGDWNCPSCGNLNYASRDVCNKKPCNTPRPYGGGSNMPQGGMVMGMQGMGGVVMQMPMQQQMQGQGQGRPGDWNCPACGNLNYASRDVCNIKECATPRPMQGMRMESSMFRPIDSNMFRDSRPMETTPGGLGKCGDPANWFCPMCKNENFPTRTHCNRKECNHPRPFDPNGNWVCKQCGNDNYPHRTQCNNKHCNAPRMMEQTVTMAHPMAQMPIMNQMMAPAENWICPICNNNNYPHRMQCNNKNCNTQRPMQMQQSHIRDGFASPYGYQQQPMIIRMQPAQFSNIPMRGPMQNSRPGDWTCPDCNNHNYASRDVCNNPSCSRRKSDTLRWVCPNCRNDNFPERTVCNLKDCQTPKPDDPELVRDHLEVQGRKRSKPGDPDNWICDLCGNENFPSRTACNMPDCNAPRGSTGEKRQRLMV